VEQVTGYVGNFTATIRKKARYVDPEQCNSCGECAKVCPVVKPDEYQMGLSTRKAIYIPFPQAVPCSYILNMDDCLGNNPIACGKCAEVCEKECIDYDDQDEVVTREVGSIIVAIGLDVYDPTEMDEYGYTRFDNVITSMEFERLICAGGPTGGHFVRPSDHQRPKRIAFIQCVGSRNPENGRPYCSNICCMNTIKDALLLADHYPDVECTVYYQDIRAFGKSFEDFYQRSKEVGTRYVRGLPGDIAEDPESKNLTLVAENTTTGELERREFDLVVLSVGVEPPKDMAKISSLLTLSKTSDGFFMEAHVKLRPVDFSAEGIFLAGLAHSPKNMDETVSQAKAAAERACIIISSDKYLSVANIASVDPEVCIGCGMCVSVCPYVAPGLIWSAGRQVCTVNAALCKGCGSCATVCPSGAMQQLGYTEEQTMEMVNFSLTSI